MSPVRGTTLLSGGQPSCQGDNPPVRGTTLLSAERLDIKQDLRDIFAFNLGGDVVVDAEFVGIRDKPQPVFPAIIQQRS